MFFSKYAFRHDTKHCTICTFEVFHASSRVNCKANARRRVFRLIPIEDNLSKESFRRPWSTLLQICPKNYALVVLFFFLVEELKYNYLNVESIFWCCSHNVASVP